VGHTRAKATFKAKSGFGCTMGMSIDSDKTLFFIVALLFIDYMNLVDTESTSTKPDARKRHISADDYRIQ
jgi:hypothetical protein